MIKTTRYFCIYKRGYNVMWKITSGVRTLRRPPCYFEPEEAHGLPGVQASSVYWNHWNDPLNLKNKHFQKINKKTSIYWLCFLFIYFFLFILVELFGGFVKKCKSNAWASVSNAKHPRRLLERPYAPLGAKGYVVSMYAMYTEAY